MLHNWETLLFWSLLSRQTTTPLAFRVDSADYAPDLGYSASLLGTTHLSEERYKLLHASNSSCLRHLQILQDVTERQQRDTIMAIRNSSRLEAGA
jgi:hypothetical protein